MTNIKKVLCILMSVIMLISVLSFTVFAAPEDAGAGDGGSIDGGSIDDGSGGGEDSGSIDDGGSGGGSVDDGSGGGSVDDGSGSGSVDDGGSSGGDSGYSGYAGYVSDSDTGYYYYDEEAAASGDPNIDSIENQSETLYNTSDIDEGELKENQWSDIKITTNKVQSGGTDFTAIKDNTETDDNSQWILYVGIALIALALIGILYFIIATVVYRKKLNKLRGNQIRGAKSREKAAYDPEEFSDIEGYSNRVNKQRSYSTTPRYTMSEKRKMRQDTEEIYIPKRRYR